MASKKLKEESMEDWMLMLDEFIDNDHHESGHDADAVFDSNYSTVKELVMNSNEGLTTKSNPMIKKLDSITTCEPSDEENLADEEKKQLRCERKRHRERQRRNNVNVNFSRLSDLLKRIEESDLDSDVSDDEDEMQVKKRKANIISSASVNTPANRVDLIARSIEILDRLHQINKSLRSTVKDTRRQLKKSKDLVDKKMIPNIDSRMGGMMEANTMFNNPFGGVMMMMPNVNMMQAHADGRQQQPMMMMVPMMMPNHMISGISQNRRAEESHDLNQPSGMQRCGNRSLNTGDTEMNSNHISTSGNLNEYHTPPYHNMLPHNMMGMFHPIPLVNSTMQMNSSQSSAHPQMNSMQNSSSSIQTNQSNSQMYQHGQSSDNLRYKRSDEGSSYGGNLAHCA